VRGFKPGAFTLSRAAAILRDKVSTDFAFSEFALQIKDALDKASLSEIPFADKDDRCDKFQVFRPTFSEHH
jgi:hypothetical protein